MSEEVARWMPASVHHAGFCGRGCLFFLSSRPTHRAPRALCRVHANYLCRQRADGPLHSECRCPVRSAEALAVAVAAPAALVAMILPSRSNSVLLNAAKRRCSRSAMSLAACSRRMFNAFFDHRLQAGEAILQQVACSAQAHTAHHNVFRHRAGKHNQLNIRNSFSK